MQRTGRGDMTVRGRGCMADQQPHPPSAHTQHDHQPVVASSCSGEHSDQRTGQQQRSAGVDGHTVQWSGNQDTGTDPSYEQREDSISTREQRLSRNQEPDDELPLGSEANTLPQGQGDGGGTTHPPVDKRLWLLRQLIGGGGGGGGGAQLLLSGWSSFNSDGSNLTSCSNQSATSVQSWLQERQEDPEQILLNLGFGCSSPTTPTPMYTRVPDRFLARHTHPASADFYVDDDVFPGEGPSAPEAAPSRNLSRAMSGWSRARSMSSALLGLKLLTSMQQSPGPLSPFFPMPDPSPLSGTSPCPTPPGRARSVLHIDNQRALAKQGFYGDHLPEALESEMSLRGEDGQEEVKLRKKSAEDRRRQFQKTRSSRQYSLVESGDDEEGEGADRHSLDSQLMKSVDFSTTTESTDSGGELSTSAPTTPGDVFLDRSPSPLSLGSPAFPSDRLLDMEDLYFPHREKSSSWGAGSSRRRRKSSDLLDVDSDVTPCASRQPTIEKVPTLTATQAERLEGELDREEEEEDEGRRGGRSQSSSEANQKTVSIVVVSEDAKRHVVSSHPPPPPPSSQTSRESRGPGGGMHFLNIVHAAVDRLSDSGSEHTLVDQNSSSSGSPRPVTGSESPGLFPPTPTPENPQCSELARNERDSEREGGGGREGSVSGSTRQLEPGPVLYVYHKQGPSDAESSGGVKTRDENDNLPPSLPKQGQRLHPLPGSRHGLMDEDLPRMSSVQSDSSGFVDTEGSNDTTAIDPASLKVSHLGSSCESSGTMASTVTVVGANSSSIGNLSTNRLNNGQYQTADSWTALKDSPDSHKRRSKSADDILQENHSSGSINSSGAHHSQSQRFITMCYIPHLNQPKPSALPVNTIKDLLAASSRDGRHSPKGPAHISVVLKGRMRGEREGGVNEVPLSEELAQASVSSNRQVPRVAVHRATLDSSSMEGSRGGSGDELERDDRPVPYPSWRPSSRKPLPSRFLHGGAGPATDEESLASVGEGSSVYSCASTSDSLPSGAPSSPWGTASAAVLDCHKLIKMINQPTVLKGRKTRMVQYRPRRPLRDWPGLMKRKRLQEESRLAQYALQKFKTELNFMETSVMGRYHLDYENMSREEREDIEELQHLWAEVRHHAIETEHLLMSRMKAMATGNDNFNFLSSIHVLQQLIDLLKEQAFQKQLNTGEDQEEYREEEEEEEWMEEERGMRRYRSWGSSHARRSSLDSWGDPPRYSSSRVRGRYSSSTSHLPHSPVFTEASYDQFRSSLVSEIREEMRSSLHSLQQDLQKRDQDIHRLQMQMMIESQGQGQHQCRNSKRSRSTQPMSRPSPSSGSSRRRGSKETDV